MLVNEGKDRFRACLRVDGVPNMGCARWPLGGRRPPSPRLLMRHMYFAHIERTDKRSHILDMLHH